ncbi:MULTISPECIES: hypothetical protein [unclassified Variovorax]|uniref:hypothetical protein n=1 Tax=unclassified Variovorax TaxID=663243 RepID=UPI001316FF0A|nr:MULTISPECIES: hypothetical protein [unclassified Variovorax]VTU43046.1 hypothetical protein SRS16P1_00423 [Variovorax sp. SRS16]VTU43074.1 hypothetical protein E5P1_00420 [Variovorax sp. PBL-E5]VTU43492.1 hypothetical protein H6P1_00483 [Variovorax sp. PBL-H6]
MLIEEVWEQLRRYGEEMDLTGALTLQQLIDSHRSLRAAASQSNDERRQVIGDARNRAIEAAKQEVLHGEYVSMQRLSTMTVGEIGRLVHDYPR